MAESVSDALEAQLSLCDENLGELLEPIRHWKERTRGSSPVLKTTNMPKISCRS